jgi:hypothetical protein
MKENNRKERVENLGKPVIRGPTEQERISERWEGKFRKASWQAFLSLYWRVFMGLQCLIMSGGWRHRVRACVRVCSSHQFPSSSHGTPARGGLSLFSVTPFFHEPHLASAWGSWHRHLIRVQESSRRAGSGLVSTRSHSSLLIHNLTSSPNKIRMTNSWRMRWTGCVVRVGRRGILIRFWWKSKKERDK